MTNLCAGLAFGLIAAVTMLGNHAAPSTVGLYGETVSMCEKPVDSGQLAVIAGF